IEPGPSRATVWDGLRPECIQCELQSVFHDIAHGGERDRNRTRAIEHEPRCGWPAWRDGVDPPPKHLGALPGLICHTVRRFMSETVHLHPTCIVFTGASLAVSVTTSRLESSALLKSSSTRWEFK